MLAAPQTISLREYIDWRFAEEEKHRREAGTLFLEFNTRERSSMEKRLEGMNEFRQQLNDQATRFATRVELELRCNELERRVRILEQFQANITGRIAVVAGMTVILSLVISIVLHFLH